MIQTIREVFLSREKNESVEGALTEEDSMAEFERLEEESRIKGRLEEAELLCKSQVMLTIKIKSQEKF